MATLIYTIFTIAHILLLIWGLRLWRQSGSIRLFLVLLPIIGLVYDNAVIALGSLPGPGELLQSLNVGRFLLHAIITPMLIMAALDMARRAGVGWASNQIVFALFGVFTVILILFGLSEMPRMVFEPVVYGSTLRYVDTAVAGPPLPSIITITLIIIIGIFIWRKQRWPWLFAGALIMFIGSAMPPSVVGPAIGSGAEVVLLTSLLATEAHIQKTVKNVQDTNSSFTIHNSYWTLAFLF